MAVRSRPSPEDDPTPVLERAGAQESAGPQGDVEWLARAAAVIEPGREAALLASELLAEVFSHARECYPEECCGILLARPGVGPTRAVRCTNVQDQRRSAGESDLDARRGFWIDEREQMLALREADARGEELCSVYHSHVDTRAYLSLADLRGALGPDGAPLWPGASQVVVAVRDGVVREAALFEWHESEGCYHGRALRERR